MSLQALLRLARRLLSKEQRRFIKFCLVGASGVPVNLLFTYLGYQLLFSAQGEAARKAAAFLLGIAVSILTNFLLNELWTWRDRAALQRGVLGRLGRFYLVCSLASLIQFGTAMALTLWLALHYLLAQLAGIALATAVNFVVNNAWTFRERQRVPGCSAGPAALADVGGGRRDEDEAATTDVVAGGDGRPGSDRVQGR